LAHGGRNDEATALLTNVLKTAPDLPLAHAAFGALLLRQDKNDEAMAHLERVRQRAMPMSSSSSTTALR